MRDALDHPVFFALVMTMVVVAFMAIGSWAFKAAGLPGPAHLMKS